MQAKSTHTQSGNQPFVSFIIPVYNVPTDMVRECIESILKLSLRSNEREIILVDDGSDTAPLQMLGELTDKIIYIRQKNSGVSAARNIGLELAHGEFIQFIDGDDMLLQASYEHVLDILRYEKADIVMFDFTNKPEVVSYEDQPAITGTKLMRESNIHGSACGLIFRRRMAGSLRFTRGIRYGEDEEFTAQLILRAERISRTTAKAYYYRMRPASAVNAADLRSRLSRLEDSKKVIFNLYEKTDTLPLVERKAMQRRIAQLTMDYIYNVITQTQDRHYLDRQLKELSQKGLFPLPDQDYTAKYKWFRRMTNSGFGLTILMRTLPMLNKER